MLCGQRLGSVMHIYAAAVKELNLLLIKDYSHSSCKNHINITTHVFLNSQVLKSTPATDYCNAKMNESYSWKVCPK